MSSYLETVILLSTRSALCLGRWVKKVKYFVKILIKKETYSEGVGKTCSRAQIATEDWSTWRLCHCQNWGGLRTFFLKTNLTKIFFVAGNRRERERGGEGEEEARKAGKEERRGKAESRKRESCRKGESWRKGYWRKCGTSREGWRGEGDHKWNGRKSSRRWNKQTWTRG